MSKVTNMTMMFQNAESFNQDIGNWNVGNVTIMWYMFYGAKSFNQDISRWSVMNVHDMGSMFGNATSFDQNIGGWNISTVLNFSYMFSGAGLSTENYDSLLIGWASQSVQLRQNFHAGSSRYSAGAAAEARDKLINTYKWNIQDGGSSTNTPTMDIVNVVVYPNPFTHLLKVESSIPVSRLRLTNQTGQIVASSENSGELDVEGLAAGIYFLEVKFHNQATQVVKVVKN